MFISTADGNACYNVPLSDVFNLERCGVLCNMLRREPRLRSDNDRHEATRISSRYPRLAAEPDSPCHLWNPVFGPPLGIVFGIFRFRSFALRAADSPRPREGETPR